jgi:hypothetical protein
MKKVKLDEKDQTKFIGDELVIDQFRWVFTDGEKEDLKEEVSQYPEEAVTYFLLRLETHCEFVKWMKEAPTRQEHRETLEDMRKSFKKSLFYLKQIAGPDAKMSIPRLRDIDGIGSYVVQPQWIVGLIATQASVEDAWAARKCLERLLKIIDYWKEPKQKRGRPQDYTTKLAIATAQLYHHCFQEKPTTYYDGPFARIYRKLLDILELPSEDPSRAIKAGVKNYEYDFREALAKRYEDIE